MSDKLHAVYSPSGSQQKVNDHMYTTCWSQLEKQGWTKEKPKQTK